jgi:hypothetical protein
MSNYVEICAFSCTFKLSSAIWTLMVPTALTDPRNVNNRLHPLQREIVPGCQKVLPLVSVTVQAPPMLTCRANLRHLPPAAGRARA